MIDFEWDPQKDQKNKKKHKVSFDEAKSVFYDDSATEFYDDDNSTSEDRFIILGKSWKSRVLTVVHCSRNNDTTVRIISARKATKNEIGFYKGE